MKLLKSLFAKRIRGKKIEAEDAPPASPPVEEQLSGLARLLFFEIPAGLILLDKELKILCINSHAMTILHLKQTEAFFKGRSILEVLRLPGLFQKVTHRDTRPQRDHFSFTTHMGTSIDIDFLSRGEYSLLILKRAGTDEDQLKALAETTHHLRTPLTSIRGYAETLLDQPEISLEKRQEFLELILKNTEILTQIVRNIMFLSRLKSEAVSKDYTCFDLLNVTTDVASLFENVKVSETNGPIQACGDPELTRMALYSIVENAVQYGGANKPVSIDIAREELYVLITVKDHGPGIPLEAQGRIFKRFFRAKETKNLYPEGTGLGLAIAKEIAVLQGGDIAVKSQWGKGTEMTLKLKSSCKRPYKAHL